VSAEEYYLRPEKVCCIVLQCVAGCCGVVQCVLQEYYFVLKRCVAVCGSVWQGGAVCCSVVQCVAVCCIVLQEYYWRPDKVCCSVLQGVEGCCGVVQRVLQEYYFVLKRRVAVCCRVVQCVAV